MPSPPATTKQRMRAIGAASIEVLVRARTTFLQHRSRRLSAGLAFYSLFALVPTLFLAVAIAAAVVGEEAAEGRLVDRLDDIIGVDIAEEVESAVRTLWEDSNSSGFAILTLLIVLYSASILFVAWRDALETIWELPYISGIETTIRSRLFAALVPVAAGILLATIVLAELLASMAGEFVSAPLLDSIIRVVGFITPAAFSVLGLGLVYRVSTRARPRWGDIWPGTLLTGLALALLASGYGLYVRVFGGSSAAGAASAVVLGLMFVYYCAQVLLFGAEVVGATADRRDRPLRIIESEPESDDT